MLWDIHSRNILFSAISLQCAKEKLPLIKRISYARSINLKRNIFKTIMHSSGMRTDRQLTIANPPWGLVSQLIMLLVDYLLSGWLWANISYHIQLCFSDFYQLIRWQSKYGLDISNYVKTLNNLRKSTNLTTKGKPPWMDLEK